MNNARVVVRNTITGRVIQGATATVYDGGTSNTATIYSDDGVTPIAGAAMTTDANGAAKFYAADVGTPGYDITVTGSGITTYTVTDVRMHDAFDVNVPAIPTTEEFIQITDGIARPTADPGRAQLYIDMVDGLPKIQDGDGNLFALTGTGLPWHEAVTDFSADNTGATDATTDMQACIDAAAASGSTVAYFAGGTYKYSQLTMYDGVKVIGEGTTRTIFKTTQAVVVGGGDTHETTSSIVSEHSGHATNMSKCCRIEGIKFERDTAGGTTDAVAYIYAPNFQRSVFNDLEFEGGETGTTSGFYCGNSSTGARTPFKRNIYSNCYMDAGTGDALFYDAGDATEPCFGNRIITNWCIGMNTGIRIGTGMEGTVTTNNTIEDYDNGIRDNGQGSVLHSNYFWDPASSTSGVDMRGDYQKAAFNYYKDVDDLKWHAVAGATYENIVADGGSSANDTEGAPGGAMGRTKINYLRLAGDNSLGVYGTFYNQGAGPFEQPGMPTSPDKLVGIFDNAGDPNGSVLPDYVGQICRDTVPTPDDIYMAVGTANTDWEKLTA